MQPEDYEHLMNETSSRKCAVRLELLKILFECAKSNNIIFSLVLYIKKDDKIYILFSVIIVCQNTADTFVNCGNEYVK